jgi:hypothetical protein
MIFHPYCIAVCSKPLDVAFALDSSDDVSNFQWQRQKDFVSQIIDGLQIAPDGVHTGIVAYGAMPSVDLKLNVRDKDKQALIESVAGLRRAVGQRNIGSLLDMSKYQVYNGKFSHVKYSSHVKISHVKYVSHVKFFTYVELEHFTCELPTMLNDAGFV